MDDTDITLHCDYCDGVMRESGGRSYGGGVYSTEYTCENCGTVDELFFDVDDEESEAE